MSSRFGIELIMDPGFTARAYRARQIVCGQYASWAAEMHMLRMSVVSYFHCDESQVDRLVDDAARLAEASRKRSPGFNMDCQGVSTGANGTRDGDSGSIFLEFRQNDANHPLTVLHQEANDLVDGLPGAVLPADSAVYQPKVSLMEYAKLPSAVMSDAAEFASAVAEDLGIPAVGRAWRLVVLRYHSEAAGDDWSNGRWAPDLRWECLSSSVL